MFGFTWHNYRHTVVKYASPYTVITYRFRSLLLPPSSGDLYKITTKYNKLPYSKKFIFDIQVSVHRNIIPSYSQQDATFLYSYISTGSVHVSGRSFAHHQEHTTVQTASGMSTNTAASYYRGRDEMVDNT
jgi:hypothetical protein